MAGKQRVVHRLGIAGFVYDFVHGRQTPLKGRKMQEFEVGDPVLVMEGENEVSGRVESIQLKPAHKIDVASTTRKQKDGWSSHLIQRSVIDEKAKAHRCLDDSESSTSPRCTREKVRTVTRKGNPRTHRVSTRRRV